MTLSPKWQGKRSSESQTFPKRFGLVFRKELQETVIWLLIKAKYEAILQGPLNQKQRRDCPFGLLLFPSATNQTFEKRSLIAATWVLWQWNISVHKYVFINHLYKASAPHRNVSPDGARAFGKRNSLGQVSRQNFPGVFPKVLLEYGGQGYHGLARAELGALHHALLVVHKEVGTTGQDGSSFVHVGLGGTLSLEVSHKPVNQFAEISDAGEQ